MTALVPVGRYVRDLGASIARLYENALDWEHLPHVHAGSFAAIRLIAADVAGWRAEAALPDGRPLMLDLALDRDAGRWITRTSIGGRPASEIRTQAEATGAESCRVTVEFAVADVAEAKRAAAGAYYERLYADLYDEDERLMKARADAIRRGPKALELRRDVTLADGSVHAMPLYCPHQGLPLDAEPDADGVVACPWHGYRFDVRTGRCVSGQTAAWNCADSGNTRPRDPCGAPSPRNASRASRRDG